MNTDTRRFDQITEAIIGAAYKVSNTLGAGFLEKIYENAMAIELRKSGLAVTQQAPYRVLYDVLYDGVVVGDYLADMVVEETVLVELKAANSLNKSHMAQCLNYLKASNLNICLLINSGRPKVQIQRIVNSK
ncbi:MAG: GxxExxY protein [SAR324 cluster bacterium]|nr:GxxExxY protein [SAR324 cluster bacterium]